MNKDWKTDFFDTISTIYVWKMKMEDSRGKAL